MWIRTLLASAALAGLATTARAQGVIELRDGATLSPGTLTVAEMTVTVKLDGTSATTEVEQVFHNPHGRDLEGTYHFPLPAGATVADFVLWVAGQPVRGEVLAREKAREIYEHTVRQKVDPALLEWVGADTFRARVFPIPARGDARLKLTYAQVLAADAGVVAYRLPLRTAAGAPPLGRLSLRVEARGPKLGAVQSPTHPVVIAQGDGLVTASLAADNLPLDRDFWLYVGTGAGGGTTVLTHAAGDAPGTFLLVVSPEAVPPGGPVPKDVVFVLDTSGSMAEDEKIGQARRALAHCLGRLGTADRFGLVAFASEAQRQADALVAATPEAVRAAQVWVAALEARGGTNIAEALATAFDLLGTTGDRPTYLVFLTDGRPTVGEIEAAPILKAVHARAGTRVRCFVLGVGTDVNTQLLDALAVDNGGTREYVTGTQEIETRISAFYDKIATPVLTDCTLELVGLTTTDVYPKRLPDLFRGTPLTVMGRFTGAGRHLVRLRGKLGAAPFLHEAEVDFARTSGGGEHLPRLWASRKVGYLLEEIRLRGETAEVRDEVVRLAKEHGIVTPYTSYLVLEDGPRGEATEPRGFGGRRAAAPDRRPTQPMPAPLSEQALAWGRSGARPTDPDQGTEAKVEEPPLEDPVIKVAEEVDHNETDINEAYEQSKGTDDAVADKPFQGKHWNDAVGVGGGAGGAYGGRFGGRRELVARGGGGKSTERAVEAGLKWLAAHQDTAFGRWSSDGFAQMCRRNACDGAGPAGRDVATTGLALLAFSGAGHGLRSGTYREVVKRGVRWLRDNQRPDGRFMVDGRPVCVLDQAIGAMALSEVYGVSGMTPLLKGPAQLALDALLATRGPGAGWSDSASGVSDVVLTGWVVCAFRSGDLSDLTIALEGYTGAALALDRTPATTVADRAAALLARHIMDVPPHDPAMSGLADRLATETPAWVGAPGDLGAWHLGALAMFRMGGTHWRTWNAAIKEAVVRSQRRGGDEDGSWDPAPEVRGNLGRVGATALGTLTLEVYYRYGKFLGGRRRAPADPAPTAPPDPAAARALQSDGADGIEAAREIERLKSGFGAAAPAAVPATAPASAPAAAPAPATAETKRIGTRTFRRVPGGWADTAYTPAMGLTLVAKGSLAHRAVVGEDPTLADLAGLDGEVTVVTAGRAVRVVP